MVIPVNQLNRQRPSCSFMLIQELSSREKWGCVLNVVALYKSTAVHTAGWSVSAASHSWDVRGHAPKIQCSGMFSGLMVLVSIPPSILPSCGAAPITWPWHTGPSPASHKCDHPTGRICVASRLWFKSFISTMKRFYTDISVPKPTEMYCIYRQLPFKWKASS